MHDYRVIIILIETNTLHDNTYDTLYIIIYKHLYL